MEIRYKDFTIEIIDDSYYTLNSSDNIVSYDLEYFEGKTNTDRVYPTSKHGIRISKDQVELRSAIICELGGFTTIHNNSFIVANDAILICCCEKIYSLSIPELQLNWKKRFDPSTCFAIYSFQTDYIIHGELQITRIDREGNEKWKFLGRDIWVTKEGKESIHLKNNTIELMDWVGYAYELDADGKVVSMKYPASYR
jgi:hypothetical protein